MLREWLARSAWRSGRLALAARPNGSRAFTASAQRHAEVELTIGERTTKLEHLGLHSMLTAMQMGKRSPSKVSVLGQQGDIDQPSHLSLGSRIRANSSMREGWYHNSKVSLN